MNITLALDILIAVLLAVTIGYCWVLQGRLKTLRSAQSGMKKSIDAFNNAVEQAQLAITEMADTGDRFQREGDELKKDLAERSHEAVQKMEGSLGRAKSVVNDLKLLSESADGAAERLDKLIKDAKKVEVAAPKAASPVKKRAPKPAKPKADPGLTPPPSAAAAPSVPAPAPAKQPDPNDDLMAEDDGADQDHQEMMDELGGRSEVEKDLLKALRQAK